MNNQYFFKTAGGQNFEGFQNTPTKMVGDQCKVIYITGNVTPGCTNFNHDPSTFIGINNFLAALDDQGKQLFFVTTDGVTPKSITEGNDITFNSSCRLLFMAAHVETGPIKDFNNNIINANNRDYIVGFDDQGKQLFLHVLDMPAAADETNVVNGHRRVFFTAKVDGDGTDFNGNPVNTNGLKGLVLAGLNMCGQQKFFKIATAPDIELGNLFGNHRGAFLTGNITGNPITDFNGQIIKELPVTGNVTTIFVARIDPYGKQLFFKTATASNTGFVSSTGTAITEYHNNTYLTGQILAPATDFNGTPLPIYGTSGNIFIAKLDKNGKQKFFITASAFLSNSIAVNSKGIFITGSISAGGTDFNGRILPGLPNNQLFVAGLTHSGQQKFFITAGGTSTVSLDVNTGNSIAITDRAIYVTGDIIGTQGIDFNGNPLPNLQGSSDIFVAKLDIHGNQIYFDTAGSNESDHGLQVITQNNKAFSIGTVNSASVTTMKDFNNQTVILPGPSDMIVAGFHKQKV